MAIIVAGLLLTGSVQAAKVSQETAGSVAHNFMERQGVKTQLTLVDCGMEEMYLFAAADGGFVLVAGDDCVRPILAYSLTAQVTLPLPENMVDWINGYAKEIVLLKGTGRGVKSGTSCSRHWVTGRCIPLW